MSAIFFPPPPPPLSLSPLSLSQVLKAMGDVAGAEELYGRYSTVTEEDGGWLSLRDIVLSRKMPRRMLVQPLTVLTGEEGVGWEEGKLSLLGLFL